jgi:stage II sporulation protein D
MRAPICAALLLTAAVSPQVRQASLDRPAVRIGVLTGAGYDVVAVPLEEYIARVLGGEAAPDTAPAALEALAIAVRTYTAANAGRHRAEGFDLCDQTHCQVMRAASADTERAAEATAGQVLLDGTAPAILFYSSWCLCIN